MGRHLDAADPMQGILEPLIAAAHGRSQADRVALLDTALWVREHFNQRVDHDDAELRRGASPVPGQRGGRSRAEPPIPTKAWLGRAKQLLIERIPWRDVPEFVIRRPKRPFAAPMWAWRTRRPRAVRARRAGRGPRSGPRSDRPRRRRHGAPATHSTNRGRETFKLWALLTLQLWAEGLQVSGTWCADAQDRPHLSAVAVWPGNRRPGAAPVERTRPGSD